MPDFETESKLSQKIKVKQNKRSRMQNRNAFSEEDRLSPKSTRRTNLNVIKDLPS